jgi:hypothetical protein
MKQSTILRGQRLSILIRLQVDVNSLGKLAWTDMRILASRQTGPPSEVTTFHICSICGKSAGSVDLSYVRSQACRGIFLEPNQSPIRGSLLGTASKISEVFKGADKLQYVVVAEYTHIYRSPYPNWNKVVGS